MERTGHQIRGQIKSIDTSNRRIVVSHEDSFNLPKAFDFKKIKVGESVSLFYEMKDGHMTASDIRPAN